MSMESDVQDTQPTQATQNVVDPRRLGKQNSGFSDEDISDIICLLVPYSETARAEVTRIAYENSQHVVGREDAEHVDLDYSREDAVENFGLAAHPLGDYAIILRLSGNIKSSLHGYTFGRNNSKCDICFRKDPLRRLSNIHFRIFINEYGVLMLEDQSTNGTVVDETLLRARGGRPGSPNMRTLSSGSKISILMHERSNDLNFLVRVPRRDGEYEAAYRKNLVSYLQHLKALSQDETQTISAGPAGHVDLFTPAMPPTNVATPQRTVRRTPQPPRRNTRQERAAPETVEKWPREWNGSDQYNRIGQIGKGAFATVHKVTAKFDGKPYAAKELDKRRFMKNGVLDQKVENEMKIMQNIEHPNIVRYIEHFEHDERLFIIIMEFVPGGDLGGFITSHINNHRALPESMVKVMAGQLIDALGYLHRKNITHRDVKPDNILIQSQDPFVVKLTDFGLSKMIDSEETFLRTFCGTLLYCAPEVYSEYSEYDSKGRRTLRGHQRRVAGQRYDHAVDIWSLGGVLYYALTGVPPYPAKNTTSYSELLHRIMTQPLDLEPLIMANVSEEGIHFLTQMLQRRPENRATVEQLQNHPWLSGAGASSRSFDEISDNELEQSASQLSLADKENKPSGAAPPSDDEFLDDEIDNDDGFFDDNGLLGGDDTSQKENYTFGQTVQPARLFGEVSVSAFGSSGAIAEERLNLPVSNASLDETDILDSEIIRDSGGSSSEDNFSTPRRPKSQRPPSSGGGARLSAAKSYSVDELNNLTFDVASQSLGGAESILENLNMKSQAASRFLLRSKSEFTSSKRKPSHDTSDEFEAEFGRALAADKPTIKRLKSEGKLESAMMSDSGDEEDYALYAVVPPIDRDHSDRHMDLPVHKSVYWTPGDPSTWHLKYPEMTQLQHNVFESAAQARGEEFRPGMSPLWDLAMKHFPPGGTSGLSPPSDNARSRSSSAEARRRNSGSSDNSQLRDTTLPSTASPNDVEDSVHATKTSIPPPSAQIIVPILTTHGPPSPIVARLTSAPDSVVQGITVHIQESATSWGRGPENTRVYPMKMELKVPKYACKILLWKEGYEPWRDLRPWNRSLATDQECYHFYISTKATNGILVNNLPLSSWDPQNPSAPSRNWMRLYDGDIVAVWNSRDGKLATTLTFRCAWGGSSKPRPPRPVQQESLPPPALAPDTVARRLDEACAKTERRIAQGVEQQLRMEEADHDVVERQRHIGRERLRSVAFEALRDEICRAASLKRSSRKATPARDSSTHTQRSAFGYGHGAPVATQIRLTYN